MKDLSNNITNIHSNEEISNAKKYMIEYEALVESGKSDMGLIGRFFAKLFGTSMYSDIEKYLYRKYNMNYGKALTILYESYNQNFVYNPFE